MPITSALLVDEVKKQQNRWEFPRSNHCVLAFEATPEWLRARLASVPERTLVEIGTTPVLV
jgi:hypothetical protein